MRTNPRIAEYIFTIVSLVFYTGGPLPVILSGGHSEGVLETATSDFALVKLCFQLIYIITLFYLAPHWKRAVYLLIQDKLILLLMTIIIFSILWSASPEITIARSVAVFGTTLFGVYFATRYSLKQQLHLLGWTFGLVGVMSILFALGLPKYGIMQGTHAGAWRGIYTHKNGFGAIMALSTTIFLILGYSDRQKNWIFRTGLFVSIALLLLSRASSPLIYLFVIALVFFSLKVLAWEYRVKIAIVCLFTALGYVLATWCIAQAEAVVGIFGKDLTFTGRTVLWSSVWELIQKQPWLGYGYGALWSGWNSETSAVWRAINWEAPNAHNGFLEVWLGLGFLGFSVLVIHITINFIRSLTIIGQTRTPAYFFPLIVMLLMLLKNITESSFIDRNSLTWVLYVSTALSLHLRSNVIENVLFSSSLLGGKRPASTDNARGCFEASSKP